MSCILCNPSVTKTQGPCFECHRATDAEIGHRIAFLQAENVRLFNRLDTTNQRLEALQAEVARINAQLAAWRGIARYEPESSPSGHFTGSRPPAPIDSEEV